MKEYEKFDEFLNKSKEIQSFIDDRLKMMFEVFKISTLDEDGKSFWIEKCGDEFDTVLKCISEMKSNRKNFLNNTNP